MIRWFEIALTVAAGVCFAALLYALMVVMQ